MRRVLLDCGNSRLKWADAADPAAMQARIHDGDPGAALVGLLDGVDELVYVDVTGRLAAAVPAGVAARGLISTASACGVTNAYPEPARLGADRWAALIGAHDAGFGPACIIDAGTAMTADLLDADGHHRGGWIAPGRWLGAAALRSGTRLPATLPDGTGVGPATDTVAAITAGTLAAALGFVDRVMVEAERVLAVRPTLVLTGGEARALVGTSREARVVENLVLRGLAVWAERG